MGAILAVIAFLILLLYALICGYWVLFFKIALAGILAGIVYTLGHWFFGWAWPLAGRLGDVDGADWWETNRARVARFAAIALATILVGVVVWVSVSKIPMPNCGVGEAECATVRTVSTIPVRPTRLSAPEGSVMLHRSGNSSVNITMGPATDYEVYRNPKTTKRTEVRRSGPDQYTLTVSLVPGTDTATVRWVTRPAY